MTFEDGNRSNFQISMLPPRVHLLMTRSESENLPDEEDDTMEMETDDKPRGLDKYKLHTLIQAEYKSNSNNKSNGKKQEAFMNICSASGLEIPSSTDVSKWIRLFETANNNLKTEIDSEYYELLEIFMKKYEMLGGIVCSSSFPMDSVFMLNSPQFVFGFQKLKSKPLVMIDCKKPDNKKHFPINFNQFTPINFNSLDQLKIYPFDRKHAILAFNDCNNLNNTNLLRLYFVEIINSPSKCKVMSEKKLKVSFNLKTIIFDEMDQKSFMLIGKTNGNNCVVIKGQINGNSILVNENTPINLPSNLTCHSFSGSTLFGISYEKDSEGTISYVYWEHNLNTNLIEHKLKFEYDFDKEEAKIPDSPIYKWSKNVCYCVVYCSHGLWDIYIFNTETQKCHILSVGYQKIFDIFIDKKKMLSILTNDAVYKISTTIDPKERKAERKRDQVRKAVAKKRNKEKNDIANSDKKLKKEQTKVKQMETLLIDSQRELEMMKNIFRKHQINCNCIL